MKIENSSISMASSHHYSSYSYQESMTLQARASDNLEGVILSLSGQAEGKSYMESMQEYQKQQEEDAARKKQENRQKIAQFRQQVQQMNEKNEVRDYGFSSEYDLKLSLMELMLEMMKNGKDVKARDIRRLENRALDLRSRRAQNTNFKVSFGASVQSSAQISAQAANELAVGTTSAGTLWQKVTATSGYKTETESMMFASKGLVQTADGRSIDFNIEVSMARACVEQFDMLESETYIMTDPLIINTGANVSRVTDQKFLFDLDADGDTEEISFAAEGSGFLALDKNGDGVVNDGSELFGTTSGDGFKDLAAYHEDGNGWIDENDSVFSKLRVWSKDEEGNDLMVRLLDADVGAIYLGNADTQFALKDGANNTNGEIKKTGIYLKESTGQAGTISHVDLAV